MYPFPVVHLTSIPWDFYLILLALGTLVPWRGAVRVKRLLAQPSLGSEERLSLYSSTIVYQWLMVAVVLWRAFSRGLGFAELGLTASDPWRTAWIAVFLTAILCANQWASLRRITRLPETERGLLFRITEKIMPRTLTERMVFAGLAGTAGLSEEFLYRGFLFAVFLRMFADSAASMALAAILSSAWFAVGHLYQGKRGIITTFVVAMIFSAVRIWSASLVPSMAAHTAIDLVAGIQASRLLGSART